MNNHTYDQLITAGFRRSGAHLYRPHCPHCNDCISLRIPVDRYQTSKNDRRTLAKNRDLSIHLLDNRFNNEHFELYRRYINSRHADGDMVNPTPQDYSNFLYSEWSNTRFIEMRKDGRLLAVAVTDFIDNGLSAVYSYFDPDLSKRSLGTFCILKMLEQAKNIGLEYLYMGYLILGSDKMRYKQFFRPLEIHTDNRWHDYHGSDLSASP